MKAEAAWPLAIVAVLGVTVLANGVLLWEARQPAAGGLEPDYYHRALAWDTTQAERARSAALGWHAEGALVRTAAGGLACEITLTDSLGAPLPAARLSVVGVHNLIADTPLTWELSETAPGTYVSPVTLPRAGRWELRVQAVRGAERWVSVLHAEAAAVEAR